MSHPLSNWGATQGCPTQACACWVQSTPAHTSPAAAANACERRCHTHARSARGRPIEGIEAAKSRWDHRRGTTAAQQAQEVFREAAAQSFGSRGGGPSDGGQAAGASGAEAGSTAGGHAGGGAGDGQQQQQQQAPGDGGAAGCSAGAGAGAGAGAQQARAGWVHRGRGVLSTVWMDVAEAISPTAGAAAATVCPAQPPEAAGSRPLLNDSTLTASADTG